MTFTADLTKFQKKAGKRTNDIVRAVGIELSSEIIRNTPVDSGRLKNSWMFSLSGYPSGSRNEVKSGAESFKNLRTVANALDSGVLYAANNLPYAYRIEFEGWSKVKAPAGMVRVAFRNYAEAVKKAARDTNYS